MKTTVGNEPNIVLNPSGSSTLESLVGDVNGFRNERWKTLPGKYHAEINSLPKIRILDVWEEIDCGLVLAPYARMEPSTREVYETRIIVNNPRHGYLNPDRARENVQSGSVLVLEQSELWSQHLSSYVSALRNEFSASVTGTLVLTGTSAEQLSINDIIRAERGEHLFIIVLEGNTEVNIGKFSSEEPAPGSLRSLIGEGELVYVPANSPVLLVPQTSSLILVIRILEPSVSEIAELVLAMFLQESAPEIAGSHHLMTMPKKIAWMRTNLPPFLHTISHDQLIDSLRGN